MSEASKSVLGSTSPGEVRPDYFGYYKCEIAELLSKDEDFVPFTFQTSELDRRKHGEVGGKDTTENGCSGADSLFNNSIGTGLSDFKVERLKSLLRQGVFDLAPEVDEMLDPVIATCQLQTRLRNKNRLSSDAGAGAFEVKADAAAPCKKLKTLSSSSSANNDADAGSLNNGTCREALVSNYIDSKPVDVNLLEKEISNVENNCVQCHTKETSQGKSGSEGPKYLCDACRSTIKKETDINSGSNINVDKENGELDEDLRFLLENDSLLVEEAMKKYSDELSVRLGHMERQLELLLDSLVSKCRPMTCTEKRELLKLIQNLPPNNLDRVVEIVQHEKLAKKQSSNELLVDLEREVKKQQLDICYEFNVDFNPLQNIVFQDNVTLWRLYYYVKAVEKAREL